MREGGNAVTELFLPVLLELRVVPFVAGRYAIVVAGAPAASTTAWPGLPANEFDGIARTSAVPLRHGQRAGRAL